MHYVGNELDIFAAAVRWKAYVRDQLRPYMRGKILEVGAGKGSFTKVLYSSDYAEWWCLEPDQSLAADIYKRQASGEIPPAVQVMVGTEANLSPNTRFDAILYLDVLEHIADDRKEVERATARLAPGGRLIILGPAFMLLYSSFDKAIGHYRRYDRRSLEKIRPAQLMTEAVFYLDSLGMALSLANRTLLRQGLPTSAQIAFWDNVIIPTSRFIDPFVGRSFGRSVVVVWRN